MSEQLKVALARAAAGGVVTGLLTLLTVYQTGAPDDPARWEKALIAGAIALLTYVGSRGAVEGWMDTGRAERGDVQPSDVGYAPPWR